MTFLPFVVAIGFMLFVIGFVYAATVWLPHAIGHRALLVQPTEEEEAESLDDPANLITQPVATRSDIEGQASAPLD